MAFRFLLCAVVLILAATGRQGEARIKGVDLVAVEGPSAVVLVKGLKRLNIRPAPRQRLQHRQKARPNLQRRAAKRQLTKSASRQLQRRAPRTSGITGRTAAKAKATPVRKPTPSRVAQVRQKLTQIRKAIAPNKPASKAKPLTRARLAAVSKSLKTAGPKVKLDNRLSGHRTIAGGAKAYDQVPKQFRQQVKDSFQGEVRAIRLTRPMVVQRRYGGSAKESGSAYFTRQSYTSRIAAKVRLALPRGNKANLKTTHIIPKGAVILVGRTASQKAGKDFGVNAKGGGQQIYVVNPKSTKSLKMVGGLRP